MKLARDDGGTPVAVHSPGWGGPEPGSTPCLCRSRTSFETFNSPIYCWLSRNRPSREQYWRCAARLNRAIVAIGCLVNGKSVAEGRMRRYFRTVRVERATRREPTTRECDQAPRSPRRRLCPGVGRAPGESCRRMIAFFLLSARRSLDARNSASRPRNCFDRKSEFSPRRPRPAPDPSGSRAWPPGAPPCGPRRRRIPAAPAGP